MEQKRIIVFHDNKWSGLSPGIDLLGGLWGSHTGTWYKEERGKSLGGTSFSCICYGLSNPPFRLETALHMVNCYYILSCLNSTIYPVIWTVKLKYWTAFSLSSFIPGSAWVHVHSDNIQYFHMMGLWHVIQPTCIYERVPSPGRLSQSPCSQNIEHSRYFFTIKPKLEYCSYQAVSLLLLVLLPRPTQWLTQIAMSQHFQFPSVYHFVVSQKICCPDTSFAFVRSQTITIFHI